MAKRLAPIPPVGVSAPPADLPFNPFPLSDPAPAAAAPAPDPGPIASLPFNPFPISDPTPAPAPEAPPDVEPEGEGLLSKIGYALSTPGELLRGILAGEPGHRASFQHVLKNWGLLGSDQNPLLSIPGAVGLVGDALLDPINLLPGAFGVKAATEAGKAAELVAPHLGEAEQLVQDALRTAKAGAGKSARAAQEAMDAGRAFTELPKAPPLVVKTPALGEVYRGADLVDNNTGEILKNAGQASDRAMVEQLAQRPDALGDAAKSLLENQKARGLVGDEGLRPIANAGERVKAGQEAFLSAGGEFDPLSLFRLGGRLNPINYLPEVPGLTAPAHLPQVTLAEAPEAAQKVQDLWTGFKNAPGIKQLGDLFSQVPENVPAPIKALLGELMKTHAGEIAQGEAQADAAARGLAQKIDQVKPGEIPQESTLGESDITPPAMNNPTAPVHEPAPIAENVAPIVNNPPPAAAPAAPTAGAANDIKAFFQGGTPGGYTAGLKDTFLKSLAETGEVPSLERKTLLGQVVNEARARGYPDADAVERGFKVVQAGGNTAGPTLAAEFEKEFPRIAPEPLVPPNSPGAAQPEILSPPAVAAKVNESPAMGLATSPLELLSPVNQENLARAKSAAAEIEARMNAGDFSGEKELAQKRELIDKLENAAKAKASAPALPEILQPAAAENETLSQSLKNDRTGPRPDYAKAAAPTPLVPGLGTPADVLLRDAEDIRKQFPEVKNADAIAARTEDTYPNKLLEQNPTWSEDKAQATASANYRRNLQQIAGQRDTVKKGAYLDEAGGETAAAADRGASLDARLKQTGAVPADAAPSVAQRVTQFVERGGAEAPEIEKIGRELQDTYDTLHKVETAAGLKTPALKSADGQLTYAPHVPTETGRNFFNGLSRSRARQAEVFQALEEVRINRGMAPDAARTAVKEKIPMSGFMPGPGETEAARRIPSKLVQESAKELEGLPASTKQFIVDNGLQREFNEFSSAISNTHGSQIARLPAYRDLSVDELNSVFSKFGAQDEVFHSNPAVQLFTRQARHVQAMAGQRFMDRAAEQLGREVPATHNSAIEIGNGFEKFADGRVGIKEINDSRLKRGLPAIAFDDPNLAEALQKTYSRLNDPEEVNQLVKWYDDTTRLAKSYVTRPFPGYHVGNHIGNQIQSWLGGVPLNAPEGAEALQVLAGKNVKINIGGELLDRDQVLQRFEGSGAGKGAFYENLLEKAAAGQPKKAPSFNPLDPDNVFIKGAEKASAAVAGVPGRLAAGAGVKMDQLTGNAIEEADRLRHWLYKVKSGMSDRAAAADVDKYLFDYSKDKLSPFEQKYLSRAAFFYGYTRQVIPMVLEEASKNLGKVAQVTRLGQLPGKPDFLPPFARDGLGVPLSKDSEGNSVLAYNLRTPIEAAVDPFSGNPLNLLNPLLKAPLEAATGQDFFLHQPIADLKKAPHYLEGLPAPLQDLLGVDSLAKIDRKGNAKVGPDGKPLISTEANPWALWALRESPLGRLSNTASRLTDDRKGAAENLLNLFTGARLASVDPDEEIQRLEKAQKTQEKAAATREKQKAAAAAISKG